MCSSYLKIAACVAAIVPVGCANPSKDYDDFRDRVGALADSATADTGVADAAPEVARDGSVFDEAGVASYSGQFWGVCLDKSYMGDITAAIYDAYHLTFTQAADGSVTVSGDRIGLRLGTNNAPPTNVSQTAGLVVPIASTPVSASGSFSAHLPTFVTPKEANIFGQDLTVENGVYNYTVTSPNTLCGHFVGSVTAPLAQEVDETCILARPAADGSFVAPLDATSLHCP